MEFRRGTEVKKKKSTMWKYIIVAIIPFIIFAAMIINSVVVVKGYRQFYSDLSDSIKYATENDCFRAEYNGVVTRINDENAYNIIQAVYNCGYVNYKEEYEIKDEVFFDFGNGDRMWIFPRDDISVIILYVYEDGSENLYYSKEKTRVLDFELLTRPSRGNPLWE